MYITKTEIKSRGWSESMINKILIEPDEYADNKYGKYAPLIKLYSLSRVESLENSDLFKELKVKYDSKKDKAKISAKKAVETKEKKMIDYANSIRIYIPDIDKDELFDKALSHYNEFKSSKNMYHIYADLSAPSHFISRISINYIRHKLTDYDYELYELKNKTGGYKAYEILKKRINDAIINKYPFLSDGID